MEQIGFCQQDQQNDDWLKEQLIVWPEQGADLTLEKRNRLIRAAFGVPLPPTLRCNQPVYKDDQLVFERVYTPFSQSTRQEALVVGYNGVVSFQRFLVWESVGKPAYDGDEFVKLIIGNSLRGINFASTIQSEGNLHVEMRVSGLYGSCLIFNPPHESVETKCVAQEPICRHEIVHVGGSYSVLEQIKELTLNFSNELLGNFQLSGYVAHLSPDEFSVLFETQFSSLKFSTGILASSGSAPPAAAGGMRKGLKYAIET